MQRKSKSYNLIFKWANLGALLRVHHPCSSKWCRFRDLHSIRIGHCIGCSAPGPTKHSFLFTVFAKRDSFWAYASHRCRVFVLNCAQNEIGRGAILTHTVWMPFGWQWAELLLLFCPSSSLLTCNRFAIRIKCPTTSTSPATVPREID